MAPGRIMATVRIGLPAAGLLAMLLATACTAYHAAPLDPSEHVARHNQRGGSDSALVAYLRTYGTSADGAWTPAALALTALFYGPSLDVLRANRAETLAAEHSAGIRPAPGLTADIDRGFSNGGGSSPWGVAFAPTFTIETGGKRGARIALARARTAMAEAGIRAEAWRAMATVRRSTIDAATADRDIQFATSERDAQDSLHRQLQWKFEEGTVTRAELARSATDLQQTQADLAAAVRLRADAYGTVARAAGLAPEALEDAGIRADSFGVAAGCLPLAAIAHDSLQRLGLASHWEVAMALHRYATTEAAVRLEVARQHPDLTLGPGLFFDHGVARWAISFLVPSILLRHNNGPIEEAEAARSGAAAEVAVVQDSILADLDQALSLCRRTRFDRASADSLAGAADAQYGVAADAYQRGETSRSDLLFARVAQARAQRIAALAEQRAARASAELELALGLWRTGAPARWPDPALSPHAEAPLSQRSGAAP
ncbi:MAG: TolC family protein [Gemmatimonadota bacterium]